MKNQQVLLALLLLALTAMASVAGGMNVEEPFFADHEPEDDENQEQGPPEESFVEEPNETKGPEAFQNAAPNAPNVNLGQNAAVPEAFQNAAPNANVAPGQNANANAVPQVEGFTGGMYAGF